jgi:uncharacterized membrane protein
MDVIMLVLRLLHIFGGVAWVGGNFMLAGYVEPTVRAAGAEGGRFMQRLTGQSGFSEMMTVAAIANVLAGILLYWRDSGGLQPAWIATGTGIVFTLGGLAGILAAVVGFGVSRPAAVQLGALGKEIASAGGPPAPEKLAQMQALSEKLRQGGRLGVALMIVALLGMATARYL